MKTTFCHSCQRETGHQRALGWGTFFAAVCTGGFWLLVVPFYPLRCVRCGATADDRVREGLARVFDERPRTPGEKAWGIEVSLDPETQRPVIHYTKPRRGQAFLEFAPSVIVVVCLVGLAILVAWAASAPPRRVATQAPGPWNSTYRAAARQTPEEPETWRSDLTLGKWGFSVSEFGVATWTLTVKNTSRTTTYKDLHFKTKYWAKSGTLVDESVFGHTEYTSLAPGQSAHIVFTEFAHSQAHTGHIDIDGAVKR